MSPSFNALLCELPQKEYELLTAKMALVYLNRGQTLFSVDEAPTHLYFPVSATVSMMIDLAGYPSLEINRCGGQCLLGFISAEHPSFYRAHVTNSGLAYQLEMADFLNIKNDCLTFVERSHLMTERHIHSVSISTLWHQHHQVTHPLVH